MQSITYSPGFDPSQAANYIASEKLDGIRARWNRGKLWLRSNTEIEAPAWWTAHLPSESLDGEIYIARGQFNQVTAALRRKVKRDAEWQQIRFMAFDLPDMDCAFHRRAASLAVLANKARNAHFDAVKQTRIDCISTARSMFSEIIANGGEGIMLHRADAINPDHRGSLIKMKPLHDAEATVIAHLSGTGKNTGRLGALMVQLDNGKQFKLSAGLHDCERLYPPRIGATVTFAFNELTPAGVPRFAKFLRERHIA